MKLLCVSKEDWGICRLGPRGDYIDAKAYTGEWVGSFFRFGSVSCRRVIYPCSAKLVVCFHKLGTWRIWQKTLGHRRGYYRCKNASDLMGSLETNLILPVLRSSIVWKMIIIMTYMINDWDWYNSNWQEFTINRVNPSSWSINLIIKIYNKLINNK